MTAEIGFDRLVDIYRSATFAADEDAVTVETPDILDDLLLIDGNRDVGAASGIAVLDEIGDLAVGDVVRTRIGPPAGSLGILARTFDDLLALPSALTEEPKRFFVVEGALTPEMADPPDLLVRYRLVVALTGLLEEAAAYMHPVRQELMFVGTGKTAVPVRYDANILRSMPSNAGETLLRQFRDDVHRAQKLSILNLAAIRTCSGRPPDERFAAIIANLDGLLREVKDGYHLLASEFSYAKIRRDVETAQFDYLNKIHKTFNDIQGQLLGIPVATFVVASQLKAATKCDADFWTDAGVLGGAWIFVAFFTVAIINQWLTLKAVKTEIAHQKSMIEGDAVVAARFADIFKMLTRRIRFHRFALAAVGLIAVAGATMATFAFHSLVSVDPRVCLARTPAAVPVSAPIKSR